ncbi:endonuclease [Segetibacter aerophilus]|uniref:Endonuclease n=1 Tax=Segetibacter aerophilus TaxID=670293 RepID=A0A512BB14_9BACT|nr:endonuclease [Segetibacter aerophilus]GEO09075.1 endonuclease [Segetibacter aerophilus]
MPEGPQMVFLKDQLSHFVGETVVEAKGREKGIPYELVEGQALVDIKTFGKELLFCFPQFTIRIHLVLFGKYAIDSTLNRALQLGLAFENGEVNFYACNCRFIEEPLDNMYDWSIDVLHKSFEAKRAVEKMVSKPTQLICEALLDQNIVAGVGNKIKNEVLFRRQIHPESLVGEIPVDKLEALIEECVTLSSEYLEWKREGTDNDHWKVYKKKECPRDHVPLLKEKIGKSARSCYFCDKCQQLYLPDNL